MIHTNMCTGISQLLAFVQTRLYVFFFLSSLQYFVIYTVFFLVVFLIKINQHRNSYRNTYTLAIDTIWHSTYSAYMKCVIYKPSSENITDDFSTLVTNWSSIELKWFSMNMNLVAFFFIWISFDWSFMFAVTTKRTTTTAFGGCLIKIIFGVIINWARDNWQCHNQFFKWNRLWRRLKSSPKS